MIIRKFLFMCFIFLTGCVGISTVVDDTQENNNSISAVKGVLNGSMNNVHPTYSQEQVNAMWGDPSNIYVKDNNVYWEYNRELAWGGVVIYVGIPIPFLVPIGHRHTTVIFSNNRTIGALYEHGKLKLAACGPLMPLATGSSYCGYLAKY
jgi:hypothetical protein